MPVMDGFEAAKFLMDCVKEGKIAKTPIVAVTAAEETPALSKRLKEVGIGSLVQKPMSKAVFRQIAKEYYVTK